MPGFPEKDLEPRHNRCIYTYMEKTTFLPCVDCRCFAARREARRITQAYDAALKPSGLRVTQFTMLVVLILAGPMAVGRLSGKLAADRTTLTRNLVPLVRRRLVRTTIGGDRRARIVSATPQGVHAARGALPCWRRAQAAELKLRKEEP
jgi:DNA-binding MarR family transcriptional regulator